MRACILLLAHVLSSEGQGYLPLTINDHVSGSDYDIDIELDYKPTVCPTGQVFCLQVMACVSNCGFFFDEEDDVGPGVPDLDITVTCPEGMVFCMSSSQCIPSEASCQDSDDPVKVPKQTLNR